MNERKYTLNEARLFITIGLILGFSLCYFW